MVHEDEIREQNREARFRRVRERLQYWFAHEDFGPDFLSENDETYLYEEVLGTLDEMVDKRESQLKVLQEENQRLREALKKVECELTATNVNTMAIHAVVSHALQPNEPTSP